MIRATWTVLIALFLAACGGAPSRTLPNGSPVAVIDQACADRIEPLYDALRDLDSRLSVGMNKADYTEKLGDVRVVYDEAVRGGDFPSGACFDTARKLEDASNEYIDANNAWGECITDTDCDNEQVRPTLQAHWAAATALLDEVAIALP